jgi:putative sigma-54 modulation protein
LQQRSKLYTKAGSSFNDFSNFKGFAMTVNIQTVHFDADAKLIEHVNKKLQRLSDHHDRIVKVDVYLKLDNVVHHIKDKVAEIRVSVPKHGFFVKQTSKSFEESFDSAMDSVSTQLRKIKEKKAA